MGDGQRGLTPDVIYMSPQALSDFQSVFGSGPSERVARHMLRALYKLKLVTKEVAETAPVPEEWKNEKRL